jgi:Sec-independent protein translocase protein TatA
MRGPPGSPRQEEDGGTIQDDDWLLASVDHWILRGRTKEEIVQRVMSSFDPKELRVSGKKLRDLKLLPAGASIPNEGHLDYHRKLAEAVVTTLTELQKLNPLRVRFWVCGADLRRVPGMPDFPDDLDETTVAARLGSLDSKLQLLLNRLSGAVRLEETVANLAQTVTDLKEQLRDQRGEAEQQVGREVREQVKQTVGELTKKVAGLQEQGTSMQQRQSYAERVEGEDWRSCMMVLRGSAPRAARGGGKQMRKGWVRS